MRTDSLQDTECWSERAPSAASMVSDGEPVLDPHLSLTAIQTDCGSSKSQTGAASGCRSRARSSAKASVAGSSTARGSTCCSDLPRIPGCLASTSARATPFVHGSSSTRPGRTSGPAASLSPARTVTSTRRTCSTSRRSSSRWRREPAAVRSTTATFLSCPRSRKLTSPTRKGSSLRCCSASRSWASPSSRRRPLRRLPALSSWC